MKSASEFRSSKSEAENRIARVGKTFDAIVVTTDVSVCLNCGFQQRLRRGEMGQLYLPMKCNQCNLLYNRKFQFCVPDMVVQSKAGGKTGIIFVNEDGTHGKNRVVDRDREQIRLLRENGYDVFVIFDGEIYRMTDSSLRLWLFGVSECLRRVYLPEAVYNGEREYRCMLPDR